MNEPEVSFAGNRLFVGEQELEVEYPIRDAVDIGGRIIVLYDPDAKPSHFSQFHNLVAFSSRGDKLWTAEHPTSETADIYVEIVEAEPLTVWNFACYTCTINPSNGKLVETVFTK